MTTQLRADAPTFVPEFSLPAHNTTSVRSRKKTTTQPKPKKKLPRNDENVQKKNQEKRSTGSRRRIQRNGTMNEQTVTQRRSKNTRQRKPRRRDLPDPGVLKETVDWKGEELLLEDGAFPALTSSTFSHVPRHANSSVWDDKPADILIQSNDLAGTALEHPQKDYSFIENESADINFLQLTVLRKSRAGKDSVLESAYNMKNDVLSAKEEPLLPNGNVQTWRQTKKIDMQKLRDRWWAVVKNKPPLEAVIERTDSENSDRTSTGLEYQVAAPVYTYPKELVVEDKIVDSSYLDADDPILEAVRRNDEDALRALLKSTCLEAIDQHNDVPHNPSPLQLAIDLERPNIVQLLVSAARKGAGFLQDNPRLPPALLVAVERDYEEILHIILHSSFGTGSYFTNTRDANGDNVFHTCCKSSVSSSVFRLLIAVPNASGFVKLLSSTNNRGQNPVHVVCEQNKAEFLDILLSSTSSLGGSFALFSKVLSMQDSIGQTPLLSAVASGSSDCVMSLLMWRGNNHQNLIPKKVDVSNSTSPPCSLAWAVKAGNLDMVLLLLEFSDSGGSGYDLTGALQVAVLMRQQYSSPKSTLSQVLLTILRVLVDAGANPCMFIEDSFPLWVTEHVCRPRQSGLGRCALVMSAEARDIDAIEVLLKTYDSFLSRLRTKRRKDPVLAQQPESFFAGIEARERSEQTVALRVSLINSLVAFLLEENLIQDRSDAISSVLALYDGGAELGLIGLRVLQACLKEKSLRLLEDGTFVESVPMTLRYRATYSHPLGDVAKNSNQSDFWSRALIAKPWSVGFVRNSGCAWIQSTGDVEQNQPYNLPSDFVIISEDGQRFETHSRLVCEKSEKLAAAFRFANMSSSEEALGSVETNVSLGSEFLSLLLYHIYHGSLPTVLETVLISSEELLELLLIGEEFMCPTLIQECELRFILGPRAARRCFCPSCSLQRQPKNSERVTCTIGGKGSILANQCNIGPDVALDALVLAQHIGYAEAKNQHHSYYSLDMDVLVGDTVRVQQLQCMEALRLVSAFVILEQLPTVLSSEAFMSQTQGDDQASNALLKMCLDELLSLSNVSGLVSNKSKHRGSATPVGY